MKADAGLYFRPSLSSSLDYTYRVADINTVYQRSNRFRLENYLMQQHGLNYSSRVLKAKVYLNTENTGDSYNLRSMAENMDRVSKTDDSWFSSYSTQFNNSIANGTDVVSAHNNARSFADSERPVPGTPGFDAAMEKLANINNWDSGAALMVKARLLHGEVHTDLSEIWRALKQKGFTVLAGMDSRSYFIEPDGNYFINPVAGKGDKDLKYLRWGGFLSAEKKLFKDKLTAGAVLRFDKNDYFDPTINYRFSIVYSPAPTHNFRLAYQDGYRYPSIFEAFSNVNSGGVKRVGGLPVMSSGIFENSWLKSSIDAFQAAVNKEVNTSGSTVNDAIVNNSSMLKKNYYTYLDPEHIRSLEFGYKAVFFDGRLFADGEVYFNHYNSFIAQVEVSVPSTSNPDSIAFALYDRRKQGRYRMWTNSATTVNNWGFGFRLRYLPGKNFLVDANTSHAILNKTEANDGLEDGFNTPPWMFNLTLANESIWKNLGAGISWRWQDRYYWQSFLVNGTVPAFHALDAQVNYSLPKIGCKVRVGATNLLNQYNVSFLGGPNVGGLYYMTLYFQGR
jgi:iron complex outermembrane receptor protein